MAPTAPELALIDRAPLFLNTLDDLERRLEPGGTAYDVLMIAGLLRKLLLDGGGSLVTILNRQHRLKLRYRVNDAPLKVPRAAGSTGQWGVTNALDPEAFPDLAEPIDLDLDDFLGTLLLVIEGNRATVADIIRHVANVQGAVHAGTPGTEADTALLILNRGVRMWGYEVGTAMLLPIGRIVLRALAPLRESVARSSVAGAA
jgi:hypothetical protein